VHCQKLVNVMLKRSFNRLFTPNSVQVVERYRVVAVCRD